MDDDDESDDGENQEGEEMLHNRSGPQVCVLTCFDLPIVTSLFHHIANHLSKIQRAARNLCVGG